MMIEAYWLIPAFIFGVIVGVVAAGAVARYTARKW
jgi:hypothetical protein